MYWTVKSIDWPAMIRAPDWVRPITGSLIPIRWMPTARPPSWMLFGSISASHIATTPASSRSSAVAAAVSSTIMPTENSSQFISTLPVSPAGSRSPPSIRISVFIWSSPTASRGLRNTVDQFSAVFTSPRMTSATARICARTEAILHSA
jgi:hypothetical protein